MRRLSTTFDENSVSFMSELLKRAVEYCNYKGTTLIEEPQLGAGTDGTVWQSSVRTAIKSFERIQNYRDELECYQRFQAAKINQLKQFAVPELEGFSDELMVIEMSIVQPPFLLDFGKVYLDQPPAYFQDKALMKNWLEECRGLFGRNWPEVQSLLYQLRSFGIYYVDPKPANIRFANK